MMNRQDDQNLTKSVERFQKFDDKTINLSDPSRQIISNSLYNSNKIHHIQSQNFEINKGKSALAALTSGKNFSYRNTQKKILDSNQLNDKSQNIDISIIGQKMQKIGQDFQNSQNFKQHINDKIISKTSQDQNKKGQIDDDQQQIQNDAQLSKMKNSLIQQSQILNSSQNSIWTQNKQMNVEYKEKEHQTISDNSYQKQKDKYMQLTVPYPEAQNEPQTLKMMKNEHKIKIMKGEDLQNIDNADSSFNEIINANDIQYNSVLMTSTLNNQGDNRLTSASKIEQIKTREDVINSMPHQVIIQTAKKIQQLQNYSIQQNFDESFYIVNNVQNNRNSIDVENVQNETDRQFINNNPQNNQNIQEIFSQVQNLQNKQDLPNEYSQQQINTFEKQGQEKIAGLISQNEELIMTNQLSLFSENKKLNEFSKDNNLSRNINNFRTSDIKTYDSSIIIKKHLKNSYQDQQKNLSRKKSQLISNHTQTDDKNELYGSSQGLPNINNINKNLMNSQAQIILPYQYDQYINTQDGLIKRSSSNFDLYNDNSLYQNDNQKNLKSNQYLKGSHILNKSKKEELSKKVLQFTIDQINGSNQSQFFWQSKNIDSVSPGRITQQGYKYKANLMESILGKQQKKNNHTSIKKEKILELKSESKPSINITQEDLFKLYMNKNASEEFILENQKEILKYIDHVMNSDEKMIGYQEFSNKNMLNGQEVKNEKNSSILPSINLNKELNNEYQDLKTQEEKQENNFFQEEKKGRYDFNTDDISKKNKGKLAILLRKLEPKNQKKNIVNESYQINARVMEHWLNETLEDAEHLDIPSVILKPAHKKPLQRYGIDRQELFLQGIPNDFIDRIYRSLFVYSVGFFEMIKKILEHSGQKYALITKIWKVFAVVLEYCCITDYKMMISQISITHEQEIQKLIDKQNQKLEEFFSNEKILKQNIAILQKNNEEMERDRTNERSLRMKLEEEYMQNTKNHEEEVQLRLKFESKLNQMHTQQRETDIKYNRVLEENTEKENQINLQEYLIKDLKQKVAENGQLIQEQREQISIFQEHKTIWSHDMQNNKQMIEQMENRVKVWQDEVNTKRYEAGRLQNENSKLQMQLEILESKNQALQTRNDSLEILFEQTRKEKLSFEEKSKELKNKVDLQQVNISQHEQKEVLKQNDVQKKTFQQKLNKTSLKNRNNQLRTQLCQNNKIDQKQIL